MTYLLILLPLLLIISSSSAKRPSYAQTVCIMQPDEGEVCPGKADEKQKAFYFDPLTTKCVPFTYKGCKGNQNTFANTDNCINSCQTPYLVEKEKEEEYVKEKKDCLLPVGPGLCKAIIPMWYYAKDKGGCAQFIYGGCGGNRNQFITKDECTSFCNGA